MVLDLLDHLGTEVLLEQLGAGEAEESTSSSSGWASASAAARGSPAGSLPGTAGLLDGLARGGHGGRVGRGRRRGQVRRRPWARAGWARRASAPAVTGDWVGGRLGARVDDRLDLPVGADHVDRRLPDDLGAAAAVERLAGTGVAEAERQGRAVDRDHLGVLGQVDPGQPAPALDRLDDVGPQPAYVDQGQAAGGCRPRRLGAAGSASRSGCRLGLPGSARAARRAPVSGSGVELGGDRRRSAPRRSRGRRGGRRRSATADGSADRDAGARAGRAGPARPSVPWSAPGSSTRAQISSSSSRGAVAPRISVRPLATRSAARLSSAGAEPCRLGDEPLAGVLGDVDEPGRRGVGDRRDDHQVAQPAQQVLGEPARVLPGLDDPVDHREHRRAVAGGERVDHVVEQRVGGVAEQPGGQRVGDARRARRRPSAGRARTGCRGPSRHRRGPRAAARRARW